ncbi:hypothetical protein ABK040_000557 [Willaertia magna]
MQEEITVFVESGNSTRMCDLTLPITFQDLANTIKELFQWENNDFEIYYLFKNKEILVGSDRGLKVMIRVFQKIIKESGNEPTIIIKQISIIQNTNQSKLNLFIPLMTIDKFKELLLQSGVRRPKDDVLKRIRLELSLKLQYVQTADEAYDLYNFVKSLPTTTTKATLEKDFGIKLNGLLDSNQSAAIITGAFENGKPLVAKVLVTESEIKAVNHLGLENSIDGLVSTKVFSNVTVEGEHVDHKMVSGKYTLLVMPRFTTCLAAMQYLLHDNVIFNGGQRIRQALKYIHDHNMVHMDVKPSNIFVNENGEWSLGDFGSCVPIGSMVTSCSECYLPERVVGKHYARIGFDSYMLATSLLSLRMDLHDLLEESIMLVNSSKLEEIILRIQNVQLKKLVQELISEYSL